MGGVSVDLDDAESERIVKLYRDKYPMIAALWSQCQSALDKMTSGFTAEIGRLNLKCEGDRIHLPNGMYIRYPNLRKEGKEYLYDGRYGSVKIYGGKVVENVVQALARIVVFDQMTAIDLKLRKRDHTSKLQNKRYKCVLTVHDEIVACVPDEYVDECLAMMVEVMSQPPDWAPELPVACEGDKGKTYGDCK
jgi:DNA polymerase